MMDFDTMMDETTQRVITNPWKNWTDSEKHFMQEEIDRRLKEIEFINSCWQHGPVSQNRFTALFKRDFNKKLQSVLVNRKPKKQNKKKTVKKVSALMTDDEFNVYLTEKRKGDDASDLAHFGELPTTSLEEMGCFLNSVHCTIAKAENQILTYKLKLGEYLETAFDRFKALKKENNFTEKWSDWILKSTGISLAYSKQLRVVLALVKQYTKLRDLSISFTELYKLRSKIRIVFARNAGIRQNWY